MIEQSFVGNVIKLWPCVENGEKREKKPIYS